MREGYVVFPNPSTRKPTTKRRHLVVSSCVGGFGLVLPPNGIICCCVIAIFVEVPYFGSPVLAFVVVAFIEVFFKINLNFFGVL